MKSIFDKINFSVTNIMMQAAEVAKKHKKMISFCYLFSLLMSCLTTTAFAAGADDYPLWQTTDAVLDIIFPIIVVVGVVLIVVGVILFFVSRFNEQAVTGPLIILAVGVGLILIRSLLGNTISKIAFNQMYPDAPADAFDTYFGN